MESLTFIGTATTLLRLGPFTLLTDPNFLHRGQRAYLGYGRWSRRRTEPACQPDELPPLDAVLLSHLHGDHFDRVARRGLSRDVPVLTTAHAARRLRRWGFTAAMPLPAWRGTELVDGGYRLRITAVPGQHGPGPVDLLMPPVTGTVLELTRPDGPGLTVYVTGDTLLRPHLAQVAVRFPGLDAVVAHLGGTRLLGLLLTMDDRQGTDLVRLLRPPLTIPIHHDDYPVFRSPLADFLARARAAAVPGEIRPVRRGETVSLRRAEAAFP